MKNKQGITIAALIIAIIGLSVGFAAFSNTLQISSSASVNPDASALKVVFAKNYFSDQVTTINQLITTDVVPTTAGTGVTATNGVINNDGQDGPTLTGLSAAFTQPGQSVTYDLYVVNAGQLKAYLTDLEFGTTGSPAKKVSCTIAQTKKVNDTTVNLTDEEKATQSLVDAACEGISVSVKIGNLSAMTASGSLNNLPLEVKGYEPVQIVISYGAGSAYVDGPMNVAFGDIEINAASVAAQVAQGGGEESSSVADTYSIYYGEGLTQIQLNNDDTASISLGENSMPATYTYDSTNSIVTLSVDGSDLLFYYGTSGNNKVLYGKPFGDFVVFTTNGSTGLTLSGTYVEDTFNDPDDFIFSNSGEVNHNGDSFPYLVFDHTIYLFDREEEEDNTYFTANADFSELYPFGNTQNIFLLQS